MSEGTSSPFNKAYYKTRNTGTRNYGTRNTGATLAGHRNTGKTTEHSLKQSKYHRVVEHEKSSRIMEHQHNTKKYYQNRTTIY